MFRDNIIGLKVIFKIPRRINFLPTDWLLLLDSSEFVQNTFFSSNLNYDKCVLK